MHHPFFAIALSETLKTFVTRGRTVGRTRTRTGGRRSQSRTISSSNRPYFTGFYAEMIARRAVSVAIRLLPKVVLRPVAHPSFPPSLLPARRRRQLDGIKNDE